MKQCEGFPIFLFFLNFLCPFQNAVKTAGMTVPSQWLNLGIFFGVSLIKQVLMYLEMIFGKNKQQTMRQLQFKIDPLPAESAEIFTRGGSKLFTPNRLVNCALHMSQYFRKLIWSNFATNIWQVLHKKTHFRHSENGI